MANAKSELNTFKQKWDAELVTKTIETNKNSQDFECEAKFKLKYGREFTGKGTGRGIKGAEHAACQNILNKIKDPITHKQICNSLATSQPTVPSPSEINTTSSAKVASVAPSTVPIIHPFPLVSPSKSTSIPNDVNFPSSKSKETTAQSTIDEEIRKEALLGNKIGDLQEYCDKNRIDKPHYEEKETGSVNVKRMVCTLYQLNITEYGDFEDGTPKSNAKKVAAYKALLKIRLLNLQPPSLLKNPGNTPTPSSIPLTKKDTPVRSPTQIQNIKEDPYYQEISEPISNSSLEIQEETPKPSSSGQIKILKKIKEKIAYYPQHSIGEGATSEVFEGYFEKPTTKAAIKRSLKKDVDQSESDILRGINHQNVIRYFITETDDTYCYIAMEFADMTLEDFVLNDKPSQETLQYLATDMTQGLIALHKRDIIHRDIKPTNVLICRGEAESRKIAKLTDFGISRVKDGNTSVKTDGSKGTYHWMPPEGLNQGPGFKLKLDFDIFSLGLTIVYAMTKGTHLFAANKSENDKPFKLATKIDEYEPNWNWISKKQFTALKNLIEAMVSKEPSRRPTSLCLLEHPFYWDDKKSLDFIRAVSNDYSNIGDEKQKSKVALRINETYKNYCDVSDQNKIPSWRAELCPELQAYLDHLDSTRDIHKGRKDEFKRYNETSFLKLVELIRDYREHYKGWETWDDKNNDGRLKNIFGCDGSKYGKYFLETFPELTTVLYTLFQNESMQGQHLKPFYAINRSKFCSWDKNSVNFYNEQNFKAPTL